MKDQVDGLRQCGYPATALHSGMTPVQQRKEEEAIAAGKYRLVFAAPERMVNSWFLRLIERINVRAFAIDEAHCISHWGHDFRPEYRQLALLKDRFPKASIHAYTATATERVRQDIVEQLRLQNPAILVGDFDRPNLVFRVVPRVDVYGQALDVVRRHKNQAGIVYCISRRDTEEMAEHLRKHGCKAEHYHAGMTPDERRQAQEAFSEEQLDVIVATVAFGMGIDRSDVRCVIHAAMPKSIEHYQQEAGRAGRDGLEAECVLFYSAADVMRWESLIEKSAAEAENPGEVIEASGELLGHMQRLAGGARCRHRALSEYFGQAYPRDNCNACDVCLGEMEEVAEATTLAQKILSCVARVDQRFGAGHVTDVLLGANTDMIRRCRHDQLSTYGLLKDSDKKELTNLVHQLVDQGVLVRTPGDRPILQLNDGSWEVMRGQRAVRLCKPRTKPVKRARIDEVSWEGVDSELFESLRQLRHGIARERGVPAFVIFGDAALREMARRRPGTLAAFSSVPGVGQRKLADLGDRFVAQIRAHCEANGLSLDETPTIAASRPRRGR
jgi:ATP-dependent DNA helicase RecQ